MKNVFVNSLIVILTICVVVSSFMLLWEVIRIVNLVARMNIRAKNVGLSSIRENNSSMNSVIQSIISLPKFVNFLKDKKVTRPVRHKLGELYSSMTQIIEPTEYYDELKVYGLVIQDSPKEALKSLIKCLANEELDTKINSITFDTEDPLFCLRSNFFKLFGLVGPGSLNNSDTNNFFVSFVIETEEAFNNKKWLPLDPNRAYFKPEYLIVITKKSDFLIEKVKSKLNLKLKGSNYDLVSFVGRELKPPKSYFCIAKRDKIWLKFRNRNVSEVDLENVKNAVVEYLIYEKI